MLLWKSGYFSNSWRFKGLLTFCICIQVSLANYWNRNKNRFQNQSCVSVHSGAPVIFSISGGPTDIGDAFPMHSRCTPDASRRHRQYIADVFAMHRRCLPDVFAKFDWHVIVTYTWDHYTMVRLFNRPLYNSLSLYINCAFVTSRMHRENILKLRQDIGATSGEHRRCFQDAFRISFHKNTSWVHRECIGTISMLALNFYWHLGDTI